MRESTRVVSCKFNRTNRCQQSHALDAHPLIGQSFSHIDGILINAINCKDIKYLLIHENLIAYHIFFPFFFFIEIAYHIKYAFFYFINICIAS